MEKQVLLTDKNTDERISLHNNYDPQNASLKSQYCTKINLPYDNCSQLSCTNYTIQNEKKCFYTMDDKFLVRFD